MKPLQAFFTQQINYRIESIDLSSTHVDLKTICRIRTWGIFTLGTKKATALQSFSMVKSLCWCIDQETRSEGTSEPISVSFLILNPTCPTNPHLTKMNRSARLRLTPLTLTHGVVVLLPWLPLPSSYSLSCLCNKTWRDRIETAFNSKSY